MRNLLKLSISALAFALLAGCGTSPEEARQKLADLNIEYTKENFAEHAGRGDMQAVDLFLKAGMDPDHAMPVAVMEDHSRIIQTLEEAGAEPIIPQARPMITFLYAAKNSDVKQFRSAFSEKYWRDSNLGRPGKARRLLAKIKRSSEEGFLDTRNYEFKFQGGESSGKLTVVYKGRESEEKDDVIKENGRWVLDEKP